MQGPKRDGSYWAGRMRKLTEKLLDGGFDYAQYLEQQYDKAVLGLEKEITVWYQRLAANNDISLAAAKRLLSAGELKEFHWSVEEYIRRGKENALNQRWMKELENASARVHISHLDALRLQVRQRVEALYSEQLHGVQTLATDLYTAGYYHTAYELQKGMGVGWGLHEFNQSEVEKVLSRPWTSDGKTFRDRCWTNKDALVRQLETTLPQMLIRGAAPDKAIGEIARQFGVSKKKAGRLVMTESAFFSSAAQEDCFNDLGVEQYEIVAAFDSDTCELCGELNGRVFQMGEFEIGVTAPPFHPWCRCCTAPYFADMEGLGERFARGTDGKGYAVPSDTTFEEWKKQQRVAKRAKSDILSDRDTRAINQYKSAKSYQINAALRGEIPMTDELRAAIDGIDRAMENLPTYKGTVYRSLGSKEMADAGTFFKEHTRGNLVSYPAFTSSGTEIYDNSMDVQMIIRSKYGRDMRKYNPGESEILFPRGSKFFVDKREGDKIWLTEI